MNSISIFELFVIFFFIGLFTIGGGLVAITMMEQSIVERGLLDRELFYNMIAVSESTPGPVGVNMATYIGNTLFGIHGAVIATFAEVLPSIICIILIARFLQRFNENRFVTSVFTVIRPTSSALILVAASHIFTHVLLRLPSYFSLFCRAETWRDLVRYESFAFYLLAFFLLRRFKMNPIFIIFLSAVFGIIFL